MAVAGVRSLDVHNCMYGGRRRKWTRFVTNMEELDTELCWTCSRDDVCDATGLPHLSFAPEVQDGVIVSFPTEPEAEYPQPLCNALARGIGRCIEKGLDGGAFEFDFSEFFSGPRAPLTKTVERISVETRNATAARAVKGDGPRDETKEQAHPAMVGVGR